GHMWEDFASQTYKELDSVGRIGYHDPFSGADKSFPAPGNGPGYYRVPTLISIWATAPFLHNNALGKFNNNPSIAGRLDAFQDAAEKLLWPEKRRVPSEQHIWHPLPNQPTGVKGINATPERLELDRGWVFRTSADSWIQLEGHAVPTFIAGLTGWSPGMLA